MFFWPPAFLRNSMPEWPPSHTLNLVLFVSATLNLHLGKTFVSISLKNSYWYIPHGRFKLVRDILMTQTDQMPKGLKDFAPSKKTTSPRDDDPSTMSPSDDGSPETKSFSISRLSFSVSGWTPGQPMLTTWPNQHAAIFGQFTESILMITY